MGVAGFCYESKLKFQKLSSKAKVNSFDYQKIFQNAFFSDGNPTLQGKYINKVNFHTDKTFKSNAYFAKNKWE